MEAGQTQSISIRQHPELLIPLKMLVERGTWSFHHLSPDLHVLEGQTVHRFSRTETPNQFLLELSSGNKVLLVNDTEEPVPSLSNRAERG